MFQDEARLRHRTLRRVDEQNDPVDHFEDTLHLAAEVSVAGGVNDIDLDAFIVDGGVLGEDRDTALALLVVRVHDAGRDFLILAIDAPLLEQSVDERRFTVVDVGDNGDVTQILSFHRNTSFVYENSSRKVFNFTSIAYFTKNARIFCRAT